MVTIRSISLFYNDRETFAQTIAVHKLEGARVPHRVESLCMQGHCVHHVHQSCVVCQSESTRYGRTHRPEDYLSIYWLVTHIHKFALCCILFFLFFTSLHLIGLNLNSILMSNRKAYYNCHSNEEYMYIACQRKRCRCSIR